jgi:hypothetical protein
VARNVSVDAGPSKYTQRISFGGQKAGSGKVDFIARLLTTPFLDSDENEAKEELM